MSPPSPARGNPAPSVMYEARVRSCSTCSVNGRKEQLWSPYSNSIVCRWEEAVPKAEPKKDDKEVEEKVETNKVKSSFFTGRTLGVVVLVLITLLTLALAVVLGQVIKV